MAFCWATAMSVCWKICGDGGPGGPTAALPILTSLGTSALPTGLLRRWFGVGNSANSGWGGEGSQCPASVDPASWSSEYPDRRLSLSAATRAGGPLAVTPGT